MVVEKWVSAMKEGVFSRLDMGERKGATVGVGERERERESQWSKRERRVWLVSDKIVF